MCPDRVCGAVDWSGIIAVRTSASNHEEFFSPNHVTEYEFGTLAAHVVPRHDDTKKELRQRFPNHDLEFLELPGVGTSGYACDLVPRSVGPPSVRNKYRAYVTLTVPENGSRIKYPWERHYHGVPRAGSIVLHSFEEEIFHLAAHEAAHIQQFTDGVKVSERRAEQHAQRELKKWREK